ncbi:hypothetical protein EMIHUDRAFT_205706 [Emiliania huxleyi CCMP1516]|uniref:Uncharacterized protein n=2 Tax=Emiliania huxleyi TaxID=2903 RepID=A0A0D3JSW1_EMIH1|nr:hypothetical protein EMIHUDRAFT_205706 [Emiliania huxleyi CCMP1516]EOD26596.1 hypothetical protein EMIHUDRAFT_205706 [Emiliania huxleyi CCMP1516]|eukprot:XP_005779025.1 hypothetical protein EMIHUDRAFT_205706 [Emiliania huxleyi CCMP1516]
MSLSGASASAAAKQRHQEQRRADTSALVDAARGQRQMPELPPYVPEFMSQMLGGGAVRSDPEDQATGDDETMMQEAAVDIALQLDIASDRTSSDTGGSATQEWSGGAAGQFDSWSCVAGVRRPASGGASEVDIFWSP